MAVFVIVPSVLMSGFVFPIEAMPDLAAARSRGRCR